MFLLFAIALLSTLSNADETLRALFEFHQKQASALFQKKIELHAQAKKFYETNFEVIPVPPQLQNLPKCLNLNQGSTISDMQVDAYAKITCDSYLKAGLTHRWKTEQECKDGNVDSALFQISLEANKCYETPPASDGKGVKFTCSSGQMQLENCAADKLSLATGVTVGIGQGCIDVPIDSKDKVGITVGSFDLGCVDMQYNGRDSHAIKLSKISTDENCGDQLLPKVSGYLSFDKNTCWNVTKTFPDASQIGTDVGLMMGCSATSIDMKSFCSAGATIKDLPDAKNIQQEIYDRVTMEFPSDECVVLPKDVTGSPNDLSVRMTACSGNSFEMKMYQSDGKCSGNAIAVEMKAGGGCKNKDTETSGEAMYYRAWCASGSTGHMMQLCSEKEYNPDAADTAAPKISSISSGFQWWGYVLIIAGVLTFIGCCVGLFCVFWAKNSANNPQEGNGYTTMA